MSSNSTNAAPRSSYSAADVLEFLIACLLLLLTKASIHFLEFSTVVRLFSLKQSNREFAGRLPKATTHNGARVAIIRAVRYLPGQYLCLPQALAGLIMLRRRRASPTLVLGVKLSEPMEMAAHAWLVVDGGVLLGNEPQGFHPVSAFK